MYKPLRLDFCATRGAEGGVTAQGAGAGGIGTTGGGAPATGGGAGIREGVVACGMGGGAAEACHTGGGTGEACGTAGGMTVRVTGRCAAMPGNTVTSAERNAAADWNRSAGSLAIAVRMISLKSAGTPGTISIGARGACSRCADMI